MGCEVTSVYNDEIVGKIGYSNQVVQDLLRRDFRTGYALDAEKVGKEVTRVEGFEQSFAIGKICFTVVAGVEYTVFSAGRFILIDAVGKDTRRHLSHRDLVTSFAVSGKLSLAGVYGGELTLWDLQFCEVRLNLLLPAGSLNVSAVGLTSKYLFATDNSQPNHLCFCYDLRTGQLKSHAVVPTLQTPLRSIVVKENTMVTACGDGIWFMQAHGGELRVTRGMFGQYPKTSILCLQLAGNYVIGGGVDGYIYAWQLASLRCGKALKVHEEEVTALAVRNNFVVVGSKGRVKVYSFKVTRIEKKSSLPKVEEQEKKEDEEEIITFILVDTFEKEGTVQSIAISEKDPQLIYCQTRQGLLFQKRLPADHRTASKSVKSLPFQDIFRYCGDSLTTIHEKRMYSIYKMDTRLVFLDIHEVDKGRLTLRQERVAKLLEECGEIMVYSPPSDEIAYVSKNKVMVCQTFGKVGDALSNVNQSNFGENTRDVLSLDERPIALSFTHFKGDISLVITTDKSLIVLRRQGRLVYQQIQRFPYDKQPPKTLQAGEVKIVFQKLCEKWRDQRQEWREAQESQIKSMEQLHCGSVQSLDSKWTGTKISLGKGFLIYYK